MKERKVGPRQPYDVRGFALLYGVAETAYLTATWTQSQREVPDRVAENEG